MVAWNEDIYSKQDERSGSFIAVMKLKRKSDDFEWVVTSVYGPANATMRANL